MWERSRDNILFFHEIKYKSLSDAAKYIRLSIDTLTVLGLWKLDLTEYSG